VIGDHPDVYALTWETRFIVDPGGLEDLVRVLTSGYTPFHADDALKRFDHIMRREVAGLEPTVHAGWDLPGEIGAPHYWRCLDRLMEDLTWYAFDGRTPGPDLLPWPERAWKQQRLHRLVLPRYFADRTPLVRRCRAFVDELLTRPAVDHGRRTWCEKTPSGLLSMAFLWELFPEAVILHVKRDPMGVVASHLDPMRTWAPSNLNDVLSWLEPTYRRWLAFRDSHLLTEHRYIELRLEDLASDWGSWRPRLFERMRLSDVETVHGFDPSRVEWRHDQLSHAQRAEVERRLGWAIAGMGY
jgi:hypothetical protein